MEYTEALKWLHELEHYCFEDDYITCSDKYRMALTMAIKLVESEIAWENSANQSREFIMDRLKELRKKRK